MEVTVELISNTILVPYKRTSCRELKNKTKQNKKKNYQVQGETREAETVQGFQSKSYNQKVNKLNSKPIYKYNQNQNHGLFRPLLINFLLILAIMRLFYESMSKAD